MGIQSSTQTHTHTHSLNPAHLAESPFIIIIFFWFFVSLFLSIHLSSWPLTLFRVLFSSLFQLQILKGCRRVPQILTRPCTKYRISQHRPIKHTLCHITVFMNNHIWIRSPEKSITGPRCSIMLDRHHTILMTHNRSYSAALGCESGHPLIPVIWLVGFLWFSICLREQLSRKQLHFLFFNLIAAERGSWWKIFTKIYLFCTVRIMVYHNIPFIILSNDAFLELILFVGLSEPGLSIFGCQYFLRWLLLGSEALLIWIFNKFAL